MLFERRCPGCGLRASALCVPCQHAVALAPPLDPLPGLDTLQAWCCYQGVGRSAVLALKHRGRSDLARWLGGQLAPLTGSPLATSLPPGPSLAGGSAAGPATWPPGWPMGGGGTGSDPSALGPARPVVTWVPASVAGRRQRGYDQGRLLARSVSRCTGWPLVDLLRRPGRAGTQRGRGRDERLVGVTFTVRRPVSGPVLLVDDVTTTGASLSQAAEALRWAGATSVHGLAVAVADRDLGPWAPAGPLPTVDTATQ